MNIHKSLIGAFTHEIMSLWYTDCAVKLKSLIYFS